MTFSREPYQNAISRNEKISTRETAYFRQRLKHAVFGKLIGTFADRAERHGLTKAKLATLSGKDPAVVNRLLSLPSNLTLETLSDLALAMGYEPEVSLHPFDDPPRHNFVHEWMQPFTGTASGVVLLQADENYVVRKPLEDVLAG